MPEVSQIFGQISNYDKLAWMLLGWAAFKSVGQGSNSFNRSAYGT